MKIKHSIQILLALIMTLVGISVTNAQDAGTTITLAGTTITVDGSGAVVDGSNVTINAAGTYRLTGSLTDGQVTVDSDGDGLVTLILDGVEMRSSTSAPINIAKADSAAIVVADGTQNLVIDATSYIYPNAEEDEPNAAIFSDDDLTISGKGTLTVQGNYNDGIASKDALTITDAVITVNALDDGIRGKNALTIMAAQLNVTAGGDGLKADNDEDATLGYINLTGSVVSIAAGGDAISAETNVTIDDGMFTIASGGGSNGNISEDLSAKGIKAGVDLTINDGTFTLDSADDALHSNQNVNVNGGTFTIATGDDGVHGDTSISINDGVINITKSYEGIESRTININGGDIHLVSSDDGVNIADGTAGGPGGRFDPNASSNGYFLNMNGGTLVVDSSGDGIDANGSVMMTGGIVIVHGPTMSGNAAVDYDGTFNITGGVLVGVGSSRMAQTPGSGSSQNSLLLNLDQPQQAGTLVHIQSSDGKDILTFAPIKSYQSIAFSSPDLVMGTTYDVYFGGSSDGTATDGLYTGGTYTPGTQFTNFTVSSNVTTIGRTGRFR